MTLLVLYCEGVEKVWSPCLVAGTFTPRDTAFGFVKVKSMSHKINHIKSDLCRTFPYSSSLAHLSGSKTFSPLLNNQPFINVKQSVLFFPPASVPKRGVRLLLTVDASWEWRQWALVAFTTIFSRLITSIACTNVSVLQETELYRELSFVLHGFFFQDIVSWYNPDYPVDSLGPVDQAGLNLRDLPAFAWELVLNVCVTTSDCEWIFFFFNGRNGEFILGASGFLLINC